MLYRSLAGEKVSQLGFGAMRLPTVDGTVDLPQTIRMLRHAIDNGVNYLDTAWVYHGGESEGIVGQALKDGYRDRTFVATKSPVWMMKEPADFDRYLDMQLERLGTDQIDFTLTSSATKDTLPTQHFATTKEYIDEVLNARIWGGLHFRGSDNAGVDVGNQVADWTLARNFQPVP